MQRYALLALFGMCHASPVTILVACVQAGSGGTADASKPHPHTGLLKKYERVPPTQIGLKKLDATDEELRQGSPRLWKINLPGGWLRSVSVQDVQAPEKVVWQAINDLPNYPKMVDGVIACDVYSTERKMSGETITCAQYKLKAAGFTLSYYMKHIFEPKKHCMTFHVSSRVSHARAYPHPCSFLLIPRLSLPAQLDYTRCSDLSDSVGYWYVEDRGDGWCRVFYSTDSQLPRFIPGFAKNMITEMAAKRSTSWVAVRCGELTGSGVGGAAGKKGKVKLLFKALLLAAAAWQIQLRVLGASLAAA